MKKITSVLAAATLVALVTTGCLTSRKQVVTSTPSGFTTNYVTTVNEGNLALDAGVLQASAAIAVNAALIQTHNDPQVISALKNAKVALDGILGGTSQQTTQQVVDLLKANGNPALVAQVTSIVNAVSALEQQLLAKYGTTVAGEISLEILKSLDAGLAVGLQGH